MLVASSQAIAGDIQKWVDSEGVTHYGDKPAAADQSDVETLTIQDSFDQQAYDEATERNDAREKRLSESDKENRKVEKEATKEEDERKEKLKTRRY
jgi:hypothetical protein